MNVGAHIWILATHMRDPDVISPSLGLGSSISSDVVGNCGVNQQMENRHVSLSLFPFFTLPFKYTHAYIKRSLDKRMCGIYLREFMFVSV